MNTQDRIFVAGHRGLVGSALVRALESKGYDNLILRTRGDLDLRDFDGVARFFHKERPNYVFLAAAKVGGILANDRYPADFIRDNLAIQLSVICAAHRFGTKKLLFLGSSCIYPRQASQPMREEHLLSGPLEPTNEAYAVAKIAGIKLCQAYHRQFDSQFISLMPTNLYGPGDNFDLQSSHVLPALIQKFHDGKVSRSPSVTLWGSGRPRREFLHVDDLADSCLFLMDRYESPEIINVGVGEDISIYELAMLVREIVGFEGHIVLDPSKPDGTPRKLLDTSRLTSMGWQPRIKLAEGIEATYLWYVENLHSVRLSSPSQP